MLSTIPSGPELLAYALMSVGVATIVVLLASLTALTGALKDWHHEQEEDRVK